MGRLIRPTSVCHPLHTRYGWGSTNFSQRSHHQCMGAGKVFEIHWCWWHRSFFRATDCLHWPVLEKPSSPLADGHWKNTLQLSDPLASGAIWREVCVGCECHFLHKELKHLTLPPASPFPHILSALGFAQFLFFNPFGGCEMNLRVFMCTSKITNKTY